MKIPAFGRPREQVLADLDAYRESDLDYSGGRVFAYTYNPAPAVEDVTRSAFGMYLSENALDPTTFPSLARLEREVVRMVANLLRGDDQVVGNFTSGGTESIFLAVKSARDWARETKPHIREPEIVLPRSAHGAFHKAAHFLGLKTVIVPINRETFLADPQACQRAITPNSIMLVGSAPGYAQGVVDPIEDLASLASESGLWFHVDACVGGIQLSFMRQMPGFDVPRFDFSIPGVVSMSADMHKYGYAPKGSSVVLYRNKSFRRYQVYTTMATTTYALVNMTVQSTRSGGPMAAAWAALQTLGEEGYRDVIAKVMDATKKLIRGIEEIGDLRVLGRPDMSMFSITSDTVNIFELADELRLAGWYLQPQFSTECTPVCLHISVTYRSVAAMDAFLSDLRRAMDELRRRPPLSLVELRQQVTSLFETEGPEKAMEMLSASAGLSDGVLPEQMASINSILECLPRALGEKLLGDFVNDLYV